MTLMVEITLLAAVLLFVAWPLMRKKALLPAEGLLTESEMSDLLYRKEAAYTALKDLEFDHNTGKIDDDDYTAMKSRFEAEALTILQSIEDHKKGVAPRPAPEKKGRFCPNCGAGVEGGDRFCRECGARL